jgi:hypothetical protein
VTFFQVAGEEDKAAAPVSGADVAASGNAGGGRIFSAVLVGSTEGGAVYLGGGAVYYDPSLQVSTDIRFSYTTHQNGNLS